MLAATRRAVLSASRRSAAIADNHLLLTNFVVGCSKDLERDQRAFSSSAGAQEKPRVKLSKEKLSAKLDKLERKREQRAVKAISAGAALAEARVAKMERGIELQDKRSTAQVSPTRGGVRDGRADGVFLRRNWRKDWNRSRTISSKGCTAG